MRIMDGKKTASLILKGIAKEIKRRKITPSLAIVLVGKDPASVIYVRKKGEACKRAGIRTRNYLLPKNTSEKKLISLIHKLNNDRNINSILVQLPLPKKISMDRVLGSISPLKDVDGFHPLNMGLLLTHSPASTFIPCTPKGIMELLNRNSIPIEGKNAVIVGAGITTGKPLFALLLSREATVTICHIKTKNLPEHTKKADILISAVGKPGLIKGNMVKKGAAVIDVGINRVGKKVVGDVLFDEVKKKASWITPVPGGVGPMTVAMLMLNTLLAFDVQHR